MKKGETADKSVTDLKMPVLEKNHEGPVFKEPWQAQAFAMAITLSEAEEVVQTKIDSKTSLAQHSGKWNFVDGHFTQSFTLQIKPTTRILYNILAHYLRDFTPTTVLAQSYDSIITENYIFHKDDRTMTRFWRP